MTIGFYSPYLDSFGGGERYTLALASHWSKTHEVRIFWDDPALIPAAKKRLDIDLTRTRMVPNVFRRRSFWARLLATKHLDCLFVLTDGSIPVSFARRNILHLQVPFARVSSADWKLSRYQAVVVNSRFTAAHIDSRLRSCAVVIYPPVAPISAPSRGKRKIILSVGRFSEMKKQEVMIDAFTTAQKSGKLPGWKLVLAGGLLPADGDYFSGLQKKALKFPIELVANSSHAVLTSLYQQASVYWHAAGFGQSDPARMEHFGISTVEAMSAGCIPIVYAGGGQTEIIDHGKNGFLWHTTDELINTTQRVSEDETNTQLIRSAAGKRAGEFSVQRFTRSFDAVLRTVFV